MLISISITLKILFVQINPIILILYLVLNLTHQKIKIIKHRPDLEDITENKLPADYEFLFKRICDGSGFEEIDE